MKNTREPRNIDNKNLKLKAVSVVVAFIFYTLENATKSRMYKKNRYLVSIGRSVGVENALKFSRLYSIIVKL